MKKRFPAFLLLIALLCTLLPQITLPASAAQSGTCGENLQWSFSSGTLTVTGTGEMYDFQNGIFAPWHSFSDDILSVCLPDGLTDIGSLAFAECHNLKSISIPEGVSRIGHSAFYYCTGLEKATLPTSVKTVESYAFANCWELSDCLLSEGLETIGFAAFMGTALTEAIIPDTVTYIAASAFCGCEKLKKVSVPDGIMRIYDETFYYCKALTDVTLPDSVMCIDYAAFFSCTGLTGISLPANLIYLGSDAFRDCTALKSVTVPAGVTEISVGAFENCRALTSVTLPANLTGIEAFAFADCISLEQITLPAKVETIGDYAFSGCSKLHHIHCLGDLPKLGVDPLKYGSDETTFCYLPDAYGWEFCDYPAEPFSVVETVPATCTEKGAAEYRCSCGERYPAGETDALGHDWVADEENSKAPSCTEDGITAVRCSRCGEVQAQTVAALGHDFVDGICSRCGAEDPDAKDPCEGYTDIDSNSWYHSAADFVIANGYMGSTSTTALTFEPNTKVSRAMVASILYRICGSPAVEYSGKFTDVKEGAWYTKAIEWCAQNGLASGYTDGTFKPNATVSRQELAVFMYKLADHLGIDVSGRADLSGFADASSVPAWSEKFLQWAVSAGIVSGQANGGKNYLNPTAGAKRCEFASILMRFCDKFGS